MLSPNKLSCGVHASGRLISAELEDEGPLVVADSEDVGAADGREGPGALHSLIHKLFWAISGAVP